jgi:hypothetical protein
LVLQIALAALVADRAIERMIDEQKLHHAFLRIHGEVRVSRNLHAFSDGRRARR